MKIPKPEQYPKELIIGDEVYQVLIVKSIEENVSGDPNDETVGICDAEKKQILIQANQTKVQMFKTLIHEIIHALELEHDIKIKHKSVYKFETAVYKFLRDNF